MKRRNTLVDLNDFPAAVAMARRLFKSEGHLRQSKECHEIGEFLGMSNIAIWHAYHRGDLGVPSPIPERAKAWALGRPYYRSSGRPCRRCGGGRRQAGDDICFDCEMSRRELERMNSLTARQTSERQKSSIPS